MQNDRLKFKEDFKKRVYQFALDSIAFVDQLSRDRISDVISQQFIRSSAKYRG